MSRVWCLVHISFFYTMNFSFFTPKVSWFSLLGTTLFLGNGLLDLKYCQKFRPFFGERNLSHVLLSPRLPCFRLDILTSRSSWVHHCFVTITVDDQSVVFAPVHTLNSKLENISPTCVPVSYTHLDVYKRQTMVCLQTAKLHGQGW